MLRGNMISNIKWSKVDILYISGASCGYSGKQEGASLTLLDGRKIINGF
jgi:hypothetical protein